MGFFGRFTRPKAELQMTTEKLEWHLGDELKGNVSLKSAEEFDIEGIWVRIDCSERVKKIGTFTRTEHDGFTMKDKEVEYEGEYWDSESLYSDHVQLSNPMHVTVGFQKQFTYVIKIPSIGRETFHGVDQNVEWFVNAHMKVRGRKDISCGAYEVLVGKPTAPAREVVREVILIPCAYCSGLMPQTAIFCPNCGARRKG